jgi:hypothetical protein
MKNELRPTNTRSKTAATSQARSPRQSPRKLTSEELCITAELPYSEDLVTLAALSALSGAPARRIAGAAIHKELSSPGIAALLDESALDSENAHPSCLCIFDRVSNEIVETVPLTEAEFITLCKATNDNKISIADFVERAVKEKLNSSFSRPDFTPVLDLEDSVNKAVSLIQITSECCADMTSRLANEHSSSVASGLMLFSNDVAVELRASFKAVQDAFSAKGLSGSEAVK